MSLDDELSPQEATEPVERLLRDLRTRPDGLSPSEVEHRRIVHGPNEIVRRGRRRWPRELARQLVHPFALLLWAAAGLALIEGSTVLSVAIVAVVVVNAVVAFVQEQEAERAVEALREYVPARASVLRAGRLTGVPARELVPGDMLIIEEGTRISADARILEGSVEVDLSSLTGESNPVVRCAEPADPRIPLLQARDLVFSGTLCLQGRARAVVLATGMHTELGRIAALSERVGEDPSPLERQVLRLAWIIAGVGVTAAVGFLLVGTLFAGLPVADALVFSVGLLVANVPEGLLPTLTLALALAVRLLARTGALVKRLSAVETLGAATVICTDKTGTLTENRMTVTKLWTPDGSILLEASGATPVSLSPSGKRLARGMASCNEASVTPSRPEDHTGDPMEVALLLAAADLGDEIDLAARTGRREKTYAFSTDRRSMSVLEDENGTAVLHTKGAPESVLAACRDVLGAAGTPAPLTGRLREEILGRVDRWAQQGLRVLAFAERQFDGESPGSRDEAESQLTFVGLAALLDPPRKEVPEAISSCHRAGIRVLMITGDYGPTAAAIARRIGMSPFTPTVVTGAEIDRLHDHDLDALLTRPDVLIFARALPETKLRITDRLRALGHVVAVTGDGVNDAPALRRAHIGVAMGRSGTDVAREAATMVLTDDNFATVVAAIREGRRVYANIRKFIVYILAHLTPEVVPFLLFALSGGAIPLPIMVLQILAIDLGTDTLPAQALGRERAEPGLMERPPHQQSEGIVDARTLLRAWVLLGGVSAFIVMGGFFFTLLRAGWTPGAPLPSGSPLQEAYVAATTMTFLGIVMCQIGAGLAARTERVSLLQVGVFSNRLLLFGILVEVVIAVLIVEVPILRQLFHTTRPPVESLLLLLPFPFVVWGVDELFRWRIRRRETGQRSIPAHP